VILGLAVVLASIVSSGSFAAPPDETKDNLEKQRADLQKQEEAIAARLKALQQEVRDIQKKQSELQQKLATLRKEAEKAKEKDYVVKVEIKGRLQHETSVKDRWLVNTQGFTCELDFVGKKEFVDSARPLEGKSILVTGTLSWAGSTTLAPYGTNSLNSNPTPTMLPYSQMWPNPYPQPWPNPYPNPYPFGYGMPVPVLSAQAPKAAE